MKKIKEVLCIRTHLLDKKTYMVNRLKSKIISMLRTYLGRKGFIELFPVVASPITDPLKRSISSPLTLELSLLKRYPQADIL